jgi:hypothetical protein
VGDSKHFQGAAAMVSLTDRIQMAAFFSYRKIDATLNADSTISTILTSARGRGYENITFRSALWRWGGDNALSAKISLNLQ